MATAEKADVWKKVEIGITALGVIAAFWYLWVSHSELRATARSANAAEMSADAAEASLRPWIRIESVRLRRGAPLIPTLDFHWPGTERLIPPVLQVAPTVANVGHSAAQSVTTWAQLFFAGFDPNAWEQKIDLAQSRACAQALRKKTSYDTTVIFPGERATEYLGVGAAGTSAGAWGHPHAAELILCVQYAGGGAGRYQTQARFGLYENRSVFIQAARDASRNQLSLIRDDSGDRVR